MKLCCISMRFIAELYTSSLYRKRMTGGLIIVFVDRIGTGEIVRCFFAGGQSSSPEEEPELSVDLFLLRRGNLTVGVVGTRCTKVGLYAW